ncbi:MAG: flavin reductase [Sphingobacteriales bacterium]|uniref:flavin reductase n=1 Tax=Hydrotalea flava TaxID=714549 RepID=UPI00082C93B2|nr:flavin reductase [Hydrotalea flava]RTL51236.1 MAG: flavin reductase [Sphingobacteriales bacterium]
MQRPWNLPSLPVYSLATYLDNGINMNICTYVSPVSMQPKIYAIAVYQNTQTLQWMNRTDEAVLQLLHADQYKLVRTLGQKTGITFNKQQWLEKNHHLTLWKTFPALSGAAAYVRLKKINTISIEGDHILFLCKALQYQSLSANILTTAILSNKKIIRI